MAESRATTYGIRLRQGFADRLAAMRAAGQCGDIVQLVAAEDGVSEEINTEALLNNFDGLQEWAREGKITLSTHRHLGSQLCCIGQGVPKQTVWK